MRQVKYRVLGDPSKPAQYFYVYKNVAIDRRPKVTFLGNALLAERDIMYKMAMNLGLNPEETPSIHKGAVIDTLFRAIFIESHMVLDSLIISEDCGYFEMTIHNYFYTDDKKVLVDMSIVETNLLTNYGVIASPMKSETTVSTLPASINLEPIIRIPGFQYPQPIQLIMAEQPFYLQN